MMKKVLKFIFFLSFLSLRLVGDEDFRHEISICDHEYVANSHLANNPLLSSKIKKEIAPYLLPSNSPLSPLLDLIFGTSRPTFNWITLVQSGFQILHHQPRSYITVARHPAVPGVLFKLYYDSELRTKKNVPSWKWFVRRCAGAELIRKVISKEKIKNFVVPAKFIYVLPPSTTPFIMPGIDPKPAILVVQDMNLVDEALNFVAWKTLITPQILDELYLIIKYANGSSYRPDNIPFTQSGQFAFIDTEYPTSDPDFYSIYPYLSDEMRIYWEKLIKKD